MANKFYVPGEQRAARVVDLFATIAPRYDLINDLLSFGLHRRWKRRVAQLAAVGPGARALDLCCGSGDIAFALAARGAEVIGLDFSPPMLQIAKQRIPPSAPRHPNTQHRVQSRDTCIQSPGFVFGDAQRIPFPDNSFDAVTIGYGLRNLASWETGLREMQRVARPGGRLVVLDFGKPPNAFWRAVYFTFLTFCVPVFGRVFCHDAAPYAYIVESLKHYPAQVGVAARMCDLGLVNVRIYNLLAGAMAINYGNKT